MNNFQKIIIILFAITTTNCKKNSENTNINSKINSLEKKIMLSGDIDSYMELTNYYDDSITYQNLLPYSLKTIKESKEGYFDFYYIYLKISFNDKFDVKNITKFEKVEQDYLISFLKNGATNDDNFCKETLIYYYIHGIALQKDLQKADSIYQTFHYYDKKLDHEKFKINQYLK